MISGGQKCQNGSIFTILDDAMELGHTLTQFFSIKLNDICIDNYISLISDILVFKCNIL